jgi:transketolase
VSSVRSENPVEDDLSLTARRAKLRLLRMHFESGVGHIGGNLSALDILISLYHRVLGEEDVFVLSKGHAAGALYVALWSVGKLAEEELATFHQDGTRLSGHPPAAAIPEIPFATGSLGHGLPLATGLALAKRLRREAGRVFCLTSDGDWNEGSSWEALVFARQQSLHNLVVILDANGLQGFGTTREVADLEPLPDKFHAFGCDATEIDGHAAFQIIAALSAPAKAPRVIVARIRKGAGISFMENRVDWHYLPLTEELYRQAVREVSGNM